MINSPVASGYNSTDVSVECSMTKGLPNLLIVGLASKSVDEAKERLRASIAASGYKFPRKRIVINLAPADIPKNSSSIDLAMAISILYSDGQIQRKISKKPITCIGELSLDGSVRPVRGIIGLLKDLHKDSEVFIPEENKQQVKFFSKKFDIHCVKSLKEVVEILNGNQRPNLLNEFIDEPQPQDDHTNRQLIDFADIKGQNHAKRALLIAACGGHSALLSGPPGTGKSMLAKAFIGILPDLTIQEAMDTTHIHSLAGYEINRLLNRPQLRSPHHTASNVAIIGGGHNLKPGEISLAHNGVLFLDELPEFQKSTLEGLRQPLEDNLVNIARAQSSTVYPSRFILIATSNPCPCGYFGSDKTCNCSAQEINRYQKKLSGPIMDRIDIHLTVSDIEHRSLLSKNKNKESPSYKETVSSVRQKQIKRSGTLNSMLGSSSIKEYANITEEAKKFLDNAASKINISARSYIKTVKISRTIADLDGKDQIETTHIAEALQYRPKQLSLL